MAKFSFLTNGYVPYYSSTAGITNSGVYWDGANVGIGTTAPATKFDIAGSIRSTASTVPAGGAGLELGYLNTVGYIYSLDRTAAVYKTVAIQDMFYVVNGGASGNVGIGTITIPNSPKLGVSGTIGTYGLATDASNYQMGTLSASNGNGTTGSTTLSCAMAGTGAANCNVNLTPIGTASVVISAGTNILYRCVGGTGDGLISVNNANASCPVGTWTATSLKIN